MLDLKIVGPEGLCPVQAEGTVNGVPFYFRSRHEKWEMHIGQDPLDASAWMLAQAYEGAPDTAGYITDVEARAFINYAASERLKEHNKGPQS